jgi:hypothetical protein
MQQRFNREEEDLGNVVALEHVNTLVPDQRLATIFYVSGLGLTRDPYLMTGVDNMWVNVGKSQFHLPTGKPQVLRGHVGLVLPDRAALLHRLARVAPELDGTRFAYEETEDHVDTVSPWGNRIRCHAPGPRFGGMTLGMAYVEFAVQRGTAPGIARFYREILRTPATVVEDGAGEHALVSVGPGQSLVFRETAEPSPDYDGHHLQIYLADFSGPYRRLLERDLVSEESDQHQYRFLDIVDVGSGRALFRIEHEVRSMRHPLYARPLVNRNPTQTNRDYHPGRDSWRDAAE